MYGLELTHASMKCMKNEVCKANKEEYTTPTKTKHEITSPTKIKVVLWQNKTKNTLKWWPKSVGKMAYTMAHF